MGWFAQIGEHALGSLFIPQLKFFMIEKEHFIRLALGLHSLPSLHVAIPNSCITPCIIALVKAYALTPRILECLYLLSELVT
jgi:hypothetical protein